MGVGVFSGAVGLPPPSRPNPNLLIAPVYAYAPSTMRFTLPVLADTYPRFDGHHPATLHAPQLTAKC